MVPSADPTTRSLLQQRHKRATTQTETSVRMAVYAGCIFWVYILGAHCSCLFGCTLYILGVYSGCIFWVYILGVYSGCIFWLCIPAVHCIFWVYLLAVYSGCIFWEWLLLGHQRVLTSSSYALTISSGVLTGSSCAPGGSMWRMLYADDAMSQARIWLSKQRPGLSVSSLFSHCSLFLSRCFCLTVGVAHCLTGCLSHCLIGSLLLTVGVAHCLTGGPPCKSLVCTHRHDCAPWQPPSCCCHHS